MLLFVVYTGILMALGYLILKTCKNANIRKLAKTIEKQTDPHWKPLSREENKQAAKIIYYDVLVIGGGSTGAGCALDAATRGLKVALIEMGDIGGETSSRSTKLLHGGVRYLEKAINKLNLSQLKVVLEALSERKTIMQIAPYLTSVVKIMVPIYNWYLIPYYWILLKLYDKLSVFRSIGRSAFVNKEEVLMSFSKIKTQGLVGAIAYWDGMFDDARTNIMLAVTAAQHGATVLNHVKFVSFLRQNTKKITHAVCTDRFTNETLYIRARSFIVAGGACTDKIKNKGTDLKTNSISKSLGVHAVFEAGYGPSETGLLDTKTADGRIMFVLPWKGKVLVGATDTRTSVSSSAEPPLEDVQFIIEELQSNLNCKVRTQAVKAAWAGIRPLVGEKDEPTESIVRKYSVSLIRPNLITVSGGKWTTYRAMAKQAVNTVVNMLHHKPKAPCITEYLQIIGSHGYTRDLYLRVSEKLEISESYAKHLVEHYGTKAYCLKRYIKISPMRISPKFEFLEGEIIYCIEHEFACTVEDIIEGRFGICLVDVLEAEKASKKVFLVMEKYFGWSAEMKRSQEEEISRMLKRCGLTVIKKLRQN